MLNQIKNIGLLFLMILTGIQSANANTAQQYSDMWKEYQSLENKGSNKDALALAQKIYNQAEKDKKTDQKFKALIHVYKNRMIVEENGEQNIIADLNTLVKKSVSPDERALLEMLLAHSYYSYYTGNQYKIISRTYSKELSEDYTFWDARQFQQKISSLYLSALKEKNALQKYPLKDYAEITLSNAENQYKVPFTTLADLLYYEAIQYFSADNIKLTVASNQFEVDDTQYFAPKSEFIALQLKSNDDNAASLHTLKLLQDWLKIHQADTELSAYIDQYRLKYVFDEYVGVQKNELYANALEKAVNDYASKNSKSLFKAELVNHWNENRGNPFEYTPVQIVSEAQKIIQEFPDTYGAKLMSNLVSQLKARELRIEMEEAIVPESPFKLYAEYKNVQTVKYKIIQWTPSEKDGNYYENKEVWAKIQKQKVIRTGTFKLPGSSDLNAHSIELALSALPLGSYAMVVYTDDMEKDVQSGTFTFSPFNVTRFSILQREANGKIIIAVRDRITGFPINQAQVEVIRRNYSTGKDERILSAFSDVKGEVSFDKSALGKYSAYLTVKVQKGKDAYQNPPQYYYNNDTKETVPTWNSQIQIFTDRAIYRPGQQVFFKGIAIETKADSSRPVVDRKIEVSFMDANYQLVQKETFTTNEFGSISGFFRIPEGGLNGLFMLNTSIGSQSISVEEYKRPTFEAKMLPIAGDFQLNDTVKVKGQALAYSGASISQAEVRYMVKRKAYFPVWRYYGRGRMIWPPYSNQSVVMASGTTQTDAEGNFVIEFIAEPDRNKNDIYQYEIIVDVQDISGEVRSANTTIRVGKNGVEPSMQVADVWSPDKASDLIVSSKNLQDVAVKSVFKITIQSLIPPTHPKKGRYWGTPDQSSMTEAEHDKLFPYDLYKEDLSAANWKKGATVWTKTIEVTGDSVLKILPANLAKGMYRISSEIIDRNDTIRLENIFEVKEALSPTIVPDFIKISTDKGSYKSGETVKISLASDLNEAYVYAYLTHKDKILKDTIIQLKGKSVSWNLPVTADMKGNVMLHYEIVAQNRNYSGSTTIEIPFDRPETLSYKWTSFRNKLLPGSKETWTLQILDKNNQTVDAELLAALYDASLDQFVVHDYLFHLSDPVTYWYSKVSNTSNSFRVSETREYAGNNFYPSSENPYLVYSRLNYFGWDLYPYNHRYRYKAMSAQVARDGSAELVQLESPVLQEMMVVGNGVGKAEDSAGGVIVEQDNTPATQNITLRTNFNETAFFYPQLRKDKSGEYKISFTIPDALTTWKFLAIAHTKELKNVVIKDEVVTQKDLMIQLNKPRFVRVGDELFLNARISNLTDKTLDVTANIIFRDAQTNKEITSEILGSAQKVQLSIAPKGNSRSEWTVKIPANYEGVIFEVTATAGDKTDGESDLIPVLENRILLTESTPIFIKNKGSYEFNTKDYLTQSGTSQTKSITFEYTAQPVWQALMALPYLNEQEDASATSLFYRYYAHSLASYILKSIPESKSLLEAWKKEGSLKSALEKNQELKSVILEATPWLRDAQNETEQMQQLFKLLNDAEDHTGKDKLLKKLKELQNQSGGLTWYPGMASNRYMTQNIMLGFYQLQQLGVLNLTTDAEVSDLIEKGLKYLESEVAKSYTEIKKRDTSYLKNDHLGYTEIQYLFLISHIKDKKLTEAEKYYFEQAQKFGLQKSNYAKAAIALTLNRMNDKKAALSILNSFKQSAVVSEKEGMYWKSANSYFWYHAPIETQALIIQAFNEISNDTKTVDQLKVWLLRQKQTNRWEQPRATVDACYALLLTGGDWKKTSNDVVTYDKKPLTSKDFTLGTAYIKTTWSVETGEKVPAKIKIQKKTNTPSFGAIYHQYWENLDKVKATTGDLQVKRTIYIVQNTESGEKLIPVTESQPLKAGDKVRIKLELKIDRDMEFFHLQDARASGFEPANVLSGYRYQNGLGYYEVTGDAATHWYMDFVRKGNYVFEYTVFVNVAGSYSSGVVSGECLYAPEFRFQSAGSYLIVGN